MYHKSKYTPLHPEKYKGDPTDIICRSSWERKFCVWCDQNPAILEWGSETTIIPYKCPTDNRWHSYYVDFKIKVKDNKGAVKTYLVEIKPFSQTQPPVQPLRRTRRYITEVMTYGKNSAKWRAANEFCRDRGWEFVILTEHQLGV